MWVEAFINCEVILLVLNSTVSAYLYLVLTSFYCRGDSFCWRRDLFCYLFNSSILNGKEKAPYEAKAAKRKADYEKLMNAYNRKKVDTSCFLFCCLCALIALFIRYTFFDVARQVRLMMEMRNQTSPNLKWMMKMTRQVER